MALNFIKTFTARGDKTVSMTPTTTTANIQLSQDRLNGMSRGNVRLVNNSGGLIYVLFGPDNTVAATASHMPVLNGEDRVFGLLPDVQWVAVILSTGVASGKVYFTHGEGN